MMNIPDWLQKDENYRAEKSRTSFLSRTLLELGSAIGRFQKVNVQKKKPEALFFLVFVFVSVLLMSLSRNMLFTYVLLACFIIKLCLSKEDELVYIMHYSVRAFFFSCFLLFPSLFLSHTKTMMTVSLKVFLSTSFVCMFNFMYSTNEIVSCLKMLHVPDIFIFTIDTTFKSIVSLSKSCEEILMALKCRLIGKRKKKDTAMTNIAGMVFVRAKNHSSEMYDAMKCRGFTGEYYNHMKFRMNVYDGMMLVCVVLEIVMFVFLEK